MNLFIFFRYEQVEGAITDIREYELEPALFSLLESFKNESKPNGLIPIQA